MPKSRRRKYVIVGPEQVRVLQEALTDISGPQDAFMAYAAFRTGCRAGEIIGLRWSDVNFAEGAITIQRSIARVHGEQIINLPKNGEARAIRPGKSFMGQVREYQLKTGAAFSPEAYVFRSQQEPSQQDQGQGPGHESLRWSADFYLVFWKRAVASVGLPVGLRFHDLRRSCVSTLIKMNVPIQQISEFIGHKPVSITLEVYGHMFGDQKDDVADAWDRSEGAK